MGKGGKANQQESKRKEPTPEPSQEDEGSEMYSPEEDGVPLEDNDEDLLERINQEIANNEDPLKLTWAAIYKLKEEEKVLNEKMDDEMRKIQAKYDMIRMPIVHKVAKVASGLPLEKQIYTHHDLTKSICVNKNKPSAIPGYWKGVLTTVAFSTCQQDDSILDKCTRIQCNTQIKGEGETSVEIIKVIFEFSDNQIFTNKQLSIQVQKNGETFSIKSSTPIKYKANAPEDSAFQQLFKAQADAERSFTFCQDLQRAYNNSIFYYLYEGAVQGDEGDEEEGEEGEEDDEQEDEEEDIQPVKKKGVKGKSNGSTVQKPECKQQ